MLLWLSTYNGRYKHMYAITKLIRTKGVLPYFVVSLIREHARAGTYTATSLLPSSKKDHKLDVKN